MIVLDTNALMLPVEGDVDVFDELERLLGDVDPVVPPAVVEELERLADGGGEAATAASVGLDLLDRCRVVPVEDGTADDEAASTGTHDGTASASADDETSSASAEDETASASATNETASGNREDGTPAGADDAVFALATRPDATHAVTNDAPLRRRLLDAGVPVVCLRGRNKLAITRP